MSGLKFCKVYFLCLCLVLSLFGNAQATKKIKFAKKNSIVYFFQKGPKRDTIVKEESDRFYFIVSDSLKPFLSVLVENGRLQNTSNDSILRLEHMPGLLYESVFLAPEIDPNPSMTEKKQGPQFDFKTRINGAVEKEKNRVSIKIVNKKQDKLILENIFYFER